MIYVVPLVLLFGIFSSCGAVTVGTTYDADTYYFTQTYNEIRTGSLNSGTFHVGQHILGVNSVYDGHFNFACVRFDDFSGFSAGDKKYLSLNVKDFKTPVAVDPSYQGPPTYSYLSTGNFRLAIVALTADFTATETVADLPTWYDTNLYSRPKIAEITVTNSGGFQVDVTTTVDSWISLPATNFGFGLVGTDSTPMASTLRFYSMESVGGPVMVPEPSIGALWGMGGILLLMFLRKSR